MKTPLFLTAALLAAAHVAAAQTRTNAPAPAKAAPPSVAPAASFEAFKSVPDRNIFNSRRFAGRTTETPPPAPPTFRRDPVIESFALLGTLDYPKGSVAFFEGSSPSHPKAVKLDESIAGCKVTAIEPNLVRLEATNQPLELKIGFMLRREDQGEWKVREAERPADYGTVAVPSPSLSGSSFGSSSSSSRDPRSSGFSSSRDSRDSRSSSSRSNGETPAESAQRRIKEQDRNGDGKISRDEADSRLRPNFDLMDRNRDGIVDAEEYTAYYAARMGVSVLSAPVGSSFGSPPAPTSPSNFGGSNTSSSPPPPSAPSTGGTSESELLRRLMEQRARENR